MSIKGFSVGGVVQRYDYTALDNLPQGQGVSDDLKAALLQLAQKVAYIDDQGQTYYDDLYDALYPEKTLLSIAANFQQGQAVVYNTDSLDSLKQYLTVTAIYDDASTETVPSSAYTLSGTLTTGTSVITVTYEGKTDAFNVTVTAAPIALTVTNNLTGCTTSNSATSVLENTSYTAVITASSGYTLVGATVSITMGGNDITTSAYSGGIITINSVTGALVISVAAAAVVLNSISAVYTQSGTVYDTDTLDSLKTDLVVTATYSDSSTQTIPSADYTLSGTLTAGTSTITVSYGGQTTTFSVMVNAVLYNLENQTVGASEPDDYYETGLNVLQSDFACTIFLDVTTTSNPTTGATANSVTKMLFEYDGAVGGRGLAVGKQDSTDNVLRLWWMSTAANDYYTLTGLTPDPGRFRFVVTHDANSNLVTLKYKKDSGNVVTTDATRTFVPATAETNRFSFGTTGNHGLPPGTVHLARVCEGVASADRINGFFA